MASTRASKSCLLNDVSYIIVTGSRITYLIFHRISPRSMITANQLRAARALLNIDQRQTADLADLSVPTIQRMEASDGVIRANVGSLMKLISALENAGIELINPGVPSPSGGRGVRLREHVADPRVKVARQPKAASSRAPERAR